MFKSKKPEDSGAQPEQPAETVLPRREGVTQKFSPEPFQPPKRDPLAGLGVPQQERAPSVEPNSLIVGREIRLTGEIGRCERLVVEGQAEITVSNCRRLEITETGVLTGSAEVSQAEIKGIFDGTLTVRGRLTIRSSGRVAGRVSYADIEIEAGGRLDGQIETIEPQLVPKQAAE